MLKNNKATKIDVIFFFRQLATLLEANIPIVQALSILKASTEKVILINAIHLLQQELQAGKSFYLAASKNKILFDSFSCQLICIGEETGQLAEMLANISEHQASRNAFITKIKQSLFYPGMILLTGLLLTAFLLIVVIPQFMTLFEDKLSILPYITRCIFSFSTTLQQSWQIILFCLALVVYYCYHKSSFLMQSLLPQLPFISRYLIQLQISFLSRNLAIALESGLPLLKALSIALDRESESPLAQSLHQVRWRVKAGFKLHDAFAEHLLYPPLFLQLIAIGEETGKLAPMLHKAADFLEVSIQKTTTTCLQLLEPLIMLMLGVLIGGLVLSLYLPIFKLGSVL